MFPVLIAECQIFARHERVRSKAIASLVIVGAIFVVVENPARVFATSGLVNQTPHQIVLTVPKPLDSTLLAMVLPQRGIDMSVLIQWRDQMVAVFRGTGGELLGSRKMKSNMFECVRKAHGTSPYLISLLAETPHHPLISIKNFRPTSVILGEVSMAAL